MAGVVNEGKHGKTGIMLMLGLEMVGVGVGDVSKDGIEVGSGYVAGDPAPAC